MRYSVIFAFALILALSLIPGSIQATIVEFELNTEFSGAQPPSSTTLPWATARFDDGGTAGSVELKLEATNIATPDEKITEWLFNFDPSLSLPGLNFTYDSGSSGPGATAVNNTTANGYKADGDGYFDIQLIFPNSGDTFGGGEDVTYDITGAGIIASSFDFPSSATGASGGSSGLSGLKTAAHVQGIDTPGTNDNQLSGWITGDDDDDDDDDDIFEVPEPSTLPMLLLGGGLCGLLGLASYGKTKLRRKKK